MKINELYLKNFKSVEEQKFTFNNGITCFSGNNGEGKSTVIHAILILLFNSYDLSFKDYINWNASNFFISITFNHEGIDWFESFEYSEKYGTKRVIKNISTNEEWENSAAISKLNEIIDPEIAKASIVSMENEQNLITTTPAKRREYLKGLYNLEFKEQLDIIAKDLDDIDKENIKLYSHINSLEFQSFNYKEEKENYSIDEYENAKKEFRILSAEKGELELKKKKRDEVESNIIKVQSKIRQLSSSIAQNKNVIKENELKIEDKKNEINSINSENKLEEYNNNLIYLTDSHYVKIKNYTVEISNAEDSIKNLTSTLIENSIIDSIKENFINKSADLRVLKAKLSELDNHLNVMKSGKCPTCGHEITENELESHKKEYEDTLNEYTKLNDETNALELEYRSKLNERDSIINKIKTFESIVEDYKSRLTNENHKFEIEKNEINNSIEKYESVKENSIKSLNESISMIQQLIDKDMASISIFEEQFNENKINLSSYEHEFESMKNPELEIISIESKIKEKEDIVKTYEETLSYNKWVEEYNKDTKIKEEKRDKDVEAFKKQISDNNVRKAMIEKAKSMVAREFPSFVISYMVKSLENYTNEFLQKVYPKYEIKIKESKNSLAITYGPKQSDVKMASGFEKSAFSLAYMYALGKIQNYGLLIIDEGDGAASNENSIQFYNTVAKSQEYFPQIFCITHKEVAKDLLENTYNADVYSVEHGKYFKN